MKFHVVVHLPSTPTHRQQIRVNSNTTNCRALIKAAATKLNFNKKAIKQAHLHFVDGNLLTETADLSAGEELLLCTAEESTALIAAAAAAAAALPSSHSHTLKPLPDVLWDQIINYWCEQERSRHLFWIRSKLQHLSCALSKPNAATNPLLSYLGKITGRGNPWDDFRAANKGKGWSASHMSEAYQKHTAAAATPKARVNSFFPAQQAAVLSCVCRSFHRIVGRSPTLHLLGQWFWKDNKHDRWLAFSSEASWDLEVAHLLDKDIATVAICESLQDSNNKSRRRHVEFNLTDMVQMNLNKKGKTYCIKRLPCDVLNYDQVGYYKGGGSECGEKGRHTWKLRVSKKMSTVDEVYACRVCGIETNFIHT